MCVCVCVCILYLYIVLSYNTVHLDVPCASICCLFNRSIHGSVYQAEVVKACLQYRGTPDPLKGADASCFHSCRCDVFTLFVSLCIIIYIYIYIYVCVCVFVYLYVCPYPVLFHFAMVIYIYVWTCSCMVGASTYDMHWKLPPTI